MTSAFPKWERYTGPRPSLLPLGGGYPIHQVAEDLSPTMRGVLLKAPDGEFRAFGHLKIAKVFDSAVRRGLITCQGIRDGQFQYALSEYGLALRAAAREIEPLTEEQRHQSNGGTVAAHGAPIEDSGTAKRRSNDAESGSDRLARAANGAISAYADRKGIRPDEAQWLLLNSGGCVN